MSDVTKGDRAAIDMSLQPPEADAVDAVRLTDDERIALCEAQGCDQICHCSSHYPVVERIIANRLAAEEARANLRRGVLALADEWDGRLHREHPGVDPAEYTDWHSRELRTLLGGDDE